MFLGVCSWNKLGTWSNTIPTYSDPAGLSRAVNKRSVDTQKKDITVIFATYHSIKVLIDAQKDYDLPIFDLMICDEAHHTAGVQKKSIDTIKSGFYYKVHENETGNFVQTHKRLFMTATPKIYLDSNKKDQEDINVVAMNDQSIFGQEIFSYSYKQAVEDKYLSPYKIVIAVLTTEEEKPKTIISHQNKAIIVAKQLFKITNNTKNDFEDDPDPMRRVLFYTNQVYHSKLLAEKFNSYIQEYTQALSISDLERSKLQSYTTGINYMHGQTKASKRATIFQWFEKNEPQTIKIISNVNVLGEGVDVPTLDAVAFFHPRRNKINIAQIAGRVFRKPSKKDQNYTKKRGYIILPVIFYSKQPSLFKTDLEKLDSSEFKNVIDVITSMQEIDESLKVEIANHEFNRINIKKYERGKGRRVEEFNGGGGLKKDLIAQLKAKIIERNIKIRRAELKSTLLYQANVIKKTIAQLQQDLQQNPSLKTHYEQLKQLLIDNLNESFQEVSHVQAFLTQHLIIQQVLKTTVPD